jgi:uncharacterized membrane protein
LPRAYQNGMTVNLDQRAHLRPSASQRAARFALGGILVMTGVGHLTFLKRAFRAQVPDWVPLSVETTVVCSGVVEIGMGAALVLCDAERQPALGRGAAAFFAAVFPGNVSQWWNRRDAFGLDTDTKRLARLFFQPVLIYWALSSTSAPVRAPLLPPYFRGMFWTRWFLEDHAPTADKHPRESQHRWDSPRDHERPESEAQRAVHIPIDSRERRVPIHTEAPTPMFDTWPPDHHARETE